MNLERLVASTLDAHWKLCQQISVHDDIVIVVEGIQGPSRSLRLVVCQEIFESFVLIGFGRQLKSLSPELLNKLYRQVFRPFFLSLVPEVSQAYPYIVRSQLDVLHRSFRKFAIALETGMRGDEVEIQDIRIDYPAMVRGTFERILLLQLQMVTESSLHTYLDAINYWPEDSWNDCVREHPGPDDVAAEQPTPMATVLHGFLRSWGYWSEIQTALASLPDKPDSARFRERVLDILGWRLNFASRETFGRFEGLRDIAIINAVSEVPRNAQSQVQSELQDIFNQAMGLQRVLTPA